MIVTENVSDFPESALQPFGLAAIRLDDFLLDQFDLGPTATCQVITEQAAAMTHPPVAAEVLLARLARSGAPKFAKAVSEMLADDGLG